MYVTEVCIIVGVLCFRGEGLSSRASIPDSHRRRLFYKGSAVLACSPLFRFTLIVRTAQTAPPRGNVKTAIGKRAPVLAIFSCAPLRTTLIFIMSSNDSADETAT